MIICPACGTENPPGSLFCDLCGNGLTSNSAAPGPAAQASSAPAAPTVGGAPTAPAQCSSCGVTLLPGSTYCDTCGAPVGGAVQAAPQQASGPPAPSPVTAPQQVSGPSTPSSTVAQGVPSFSASAAPQTPLAGAGPRMRLTSSYSNIDVAVPPDASVVVGRSDPSIQVDLSPYDQIGSISRRHARVSVVNGQYTIEDLGSTNGTAVNKVVLTSGQPHPLTDGDEVQFGRLILSVRIG